MKKIIASITVLAVAVLPLATATSASAASDKKAVSVALIGDYCC